MLRLDLVGGLLVFEVVPSKESDSRIPVSFSFFPWPPGERFGFVNASTMMFCFATSLKAMGTSDHGL
jgi:hypothetical protein